MYQIAPNVIMCQITAPASGGSFATIASLLPAWAVTALGTGVVLSIEATAVSTAVDIRSDAAQAGDLLAADTPRAIPALRGDGLFVRSTGAAATVRLTIACASAQRAQVAL